MKQKLLLALFVLFASVGAMRAQTSVTMALDANSGNVTVNYSGDKPSVQIGNTPLDAVGSTFTIPSSGNSQNVTINSETATSGLTFKGAINTMTINDNNIKTISFSSGSSIKTLTIASAKQLTSLPCGNLGLTALSFNNGNFDALASLTCNSNQLTALDISGISAKTVDCSNNQITTLTINTSVIYTNLNCSNNLINGELSPAPGAKVTYGYQTVKMADAATANSLFDIKAHASDVGKILNGKVDADAVWGNIWQKADQNGNFPTNESRNTSDPQADDAYKTNYTFIYNNVYQDGKYRFSVTPKTASSNKINYWVVMTVNPASYPLTLKLANETIKGTKDGSMSASQIIAGGGKSGTTSGATGDALISNSAKGEQYTFAASPTEGYTFDKFEVSGGLTLISSNTTESSAIYQIAGTKTPEQLFVKPIFKAKGYTVNYKGAEIGGTYVVRVKGGDAFTGGKGTANQGQIVEVTVNPEPAYTAKVFLNGTLHAAAPYEFIVTADMNISISFEPNASVDMKVDFGSEVSSVQINGNAVATANNAAISLVPKTTATLSMIILTANATTTVKEILLNGTALPITQTKESTGIKYSTSFDVPSANATLIVKTNTLESATIASATKKSLTYDGVAKVYTGYTTNPIGLKDIIVEYSTKTITADVQDNTTVAPLGVSFTKNTPIAAGKYAVKVSREADPIFGAAAAKYATFTIDPAIVTIKTAPSVTIKDYNGVKKYDIQGGQAMLGTTVVPGKFVVTSDGTNAITDGLVKTLTAHVATVTFVAQKNGADDSNYNLTASTIQVPVKGTDGTAPVNYTISLSKVPENSGITITFKNGEQVLGNSATVAKNTALTFVVNNPNKWTIDGIKEIVDTNPDVVFNPVFASTTDKTKEYTMAQGIAHSMKIAINATAPVANTKKDYKITLKEAVKPYADGKVIKYDLSTIGVSGANGELENTLIGLAKIVTGYKDASNNTIAYPIEAGDYKVSVKISGVADYNDKTVTANLTVTPRELKIGSAANDDIVFPTSALPVAKDQKLVQAAFVEGSTKVAGTFEWETPNVIPTNGGKYTVIFKPADSKNYAIAKSETKLEVLVSNKMLVTYANPANGTLLVKDEKGIQYLSGDAIAAKTVLSIQAIANDGFELESLTLNDAAIENNSKYTVVDKSVALVVKFKQKSANPSALKVTFSKTGKGFTVDKTDAVVKFKDNFSFTVKTAAADKDKVVVKGGATVLKANENGTYTLSAMTKDTVISISLATPTKLKVAIEKETKNAKGTKMGKVQIQGVTADSTYYYGDVLTLTAFPESGVSFHSWSDSNTDNPRTYMVTTATALKPSFTGTPTGIADIEGTKVYGAEGYIYVSCEGQATVTVVTMDGRSQQVRIAGEARIETGAGIYGVILQQGTEVLKTKVVVR